MAVAKEAVEVTEVAEVAMAVVEVRLMEVDVEVAGMAVEDTVVLLLLMEVVAMADLPLAPGEYSLSYTARNPLTIIQIQRWLQRSRQGLCTILGCAMGREWVGHGARTCST